MPSASTATRSDRIPLRLYLLGAFRVECGTKTIHFSTHKVESLFAFLALHPEPHPREKLAALLWGDFTDEQARHSLRTALAAIRKELGDDILIADRETVQLNADFPVWVDAKEILDFRLQNSDWVSFRSTICNLKHLHRTQVQVSEIDLLPDFYDDWILPERERLRAIYLDAMLQLVQYHRGKSEYTTAIELAQKILVTDPANEKAYQHIIFCLAAVGDRIGALKQYDECAKKLRADLGVEPSKETLILRDQIEQELTGGKAHEALLTNVPAPLTSFIGREAEQRELKELLEKTRLLTLTGAGGCGKTRLAIQVATELANANRFKNGVWWVELASLADPGLVPQTVAKVFDLEGLGTTPILTLLANYLRAKELLLVLDNCEHLIEACAKLANQLLSTCPQLKILASSREALGIVGEVPYKIPSLSLPSKESSRDLNLVSQSEAVQLFVARAQNLAPAFTLTLQNAPTIIQICERLDGIPLALELAAARVKSLSVEQIAARLDDRFRLLTGGSRTALPRHQTLRAAIDWSYELLSDAERVMLRWLSVFAGGWTLEAAQAVCSCDPVCADDALDLLAHLVDKSLIVFERDAARYRMMETIRQYAREKLLESGKDDLVHSRHLDFFLRLAELAEPELQKGSKQWMDRLETEYDNVRVAWEHAIATNNGLAVRLAVSLRWFWTRRGYLVEGREWLTRLLPRTETWGATIQRTRALILAGVLDYYFQEYSSALLLSEQGLNIARIVGNQNAIANALLEMGMIFRNMGEQQRARSVLEESLALYRLLGDQSNIARTLFGLGSVAQAQGDLVPAQILFEESLAMSLVLGDDYMRVGPLNGLGEVARAQGDFKRAAGLYTECVEIDRKIGNKLHFSVALSNLGCAVLQLGDYRRAKRILVECLEWLRFRGVFWNTVWLIGMSGAIEASGNPLLAARLLGAVNAWFEALGKTQIPYSFADRLFYQSLLAKLHEKLDQATFDKEMAEGRKLTLEQATEVALEQGK